jgi:cation:H+ antiporter
LLGGILLLGVSLVVVLVASIIFTNAVEVLGHRMKLHQGAVGSLLAAVGTAMPETIIPVIAIVEFWGTEQANKIALGAIAGAPFMLATLAFFVTGLAVLVFTALRRRGPEMQVDTRILARDLTFFLVTYSVAVLATFLPAVLGSLGPGAVMAGRIAVAVGLLAAYGLYVKMTLAGAAEGVEADESLYLSRVFKAGPATPMSIIQFAAGLGIMIYGAHLFVKYAQSVSETAGVSPLVLSLIIVPIATELPEKFNSVVWVRKGKDTLAMGNITGAMVFQSCIPVAIGIVGTPWVLMAEGGVTMVTAVLALLSGVIAVIWLRTKKTLSPHALMIGGLLYCVFVAYVLWGRG